MPPLPDRALPEQDPPRHPLLTLAAIGLIALLIALAFAWVAGWLTPARLTAPRFTDAIQASNGQIYPGFRRAHAKGTCMAGYFEGNGAGEAVSNARIFARVRTPVLGRFSIGGGAPHGLDSSARVRSMALELNSDDGQQWRMAMNSFPFFGVSSVQAFYDQTRANTPDPATGKPDPVQQAAFAEAHPEFARFAAWAKSAPWTTSWANTTFNGVNTFGFSNSQGARQHVRWSMLPQTAFAVLTPEQRAAADADFLSEDLTARLAQGPLRWDMIVTLAEAGDPITDPSQSWPDERQKLNVGTLVVESATPQTSGACRDVNFDPLILPAGVDGSEDPILAARSAVYSVSFNRREHDIASGKAADATGAHQTQQATP